MTLPDPLLIYHRSCSLTFTPEPLYKTKCPWNVSVYCVRCCHLEQTSPLGQCVGINFQQCLMPLSNAKSFRIYTSVGADMLRNPWQVDWKIYPWILNYYFHLHRSHMSCSIASVLWGAIYFLSKAVDICHVECRIHIFKRFSLMCVCCAYIRSVYPYAIG